MDFSFTPEQLAFKERMVRFAQAELQGDVRSADEAGRLPKENWLRCAKAGVLGLPFPEEYGGEDRDIMTTVLAMEGLGYACRDNGLLFGINGQMWTVQMPILEYGSEDQKQRYLRGLIQGTLMGANAITEPNAGSDAMALSTSARAKGDGDGYVLNGHKNFCTNAPNADVFLVFATVDPASGPMGVTAFLVDRETAGLEVGPNMSKMGMRTAPMGTVTLTDCYVPASARLGREGQGGRIFTFSSEWERSAILAAQVGAMEYQLEQCITFTTRRRQFKKQISKFQSVSNRIVDMKLRLELSRLLLYKVAWKKKAEGQCSMEATLAKLYLSESWVANCQDAVLLHGGAGYLSENGIERDLRDSVGSLLYSGTSDIQRSIAARLLGL